MNESQSNTTSHSLNINLLSERKRQVRARSILIGKVQLVSGVVLSVYVVVLIGIMSFRHTISQQLSTIDQAINREKQLIGNLSFKESMFTLVASKTDLSQEVLTNRIRIKALFDEFVPLLPEQASLTRFEVDTEAELVKVTVLLAQVTETQELIDNLRQQVLDQGYETFEIKRLQRSQDGTYTMTGEYPI